MEEEINIRNDSDILARPTNELPETPDRHNAENNSLQTIKLYEHGITNGLLSVPPETFESFIHYYYLEIDRDRQINNTKEEISNLGESYKAAKSKRIELLSTLLKQKAEHGAIILKSSEIDNKLKFLEYKLTRAKEIITELKTNTKTDYSLFAGIIYFVFALLFIGADFGIALNIVATNLQIGTTTDTEGVAHISYIAYMFAIAIAGLSVVLKPAYDRLIEKPYQDGKAKRTFAVFIIICSLLVLAMLVSFGIFREEIISKGLAIQDVSTNIDAELEPKAESIGNNSSSMASGFAIVSSTFLFAIAGAISLGISVPIIYKSYRITWNNLRQKLWNAKIFETSATKLSVETDRLNSEAAIKLVEEQVADLQDELGFKEIVRDKTELLQVLIGSRLNKIVEKNKAIYQDGYNRGSKLKGKVPDEWLNETVISNTQYDNSIPSTSVPATTSGSQSRTRPFVALRRIISRNFKNKASKNGNINFEYYDIEK
jgi:hypothetical protein